MIKCKLFKKFIFKRNAWLSPYSTAYDTTGGDDMLIHEVAKRCNITKKAIQYYVEQG